MYRFIHLATASVTLLHALLGCCLHHEHCCAVEDVARVAVVSDHGPQCSHGHDHGPIAATDSSSHETNPVPVPAHEGPHQCDSGNCVFVSSGAASFAVDVGINWMLSPSIDEAEVASSVKEFAHRVPDRHAPPLAERLQSQYCVWLI